jgi:hypothetical protein
MFTTLAVAMTLSGAVAVETPIRAFADRPAVVQVAANGMMFGGKRFDKSHGHGVYGKPPGIGHVEYEKVGKPIIAEKLRKPIIAEKLRKPVVMP